jgi:hypothetical protein
MTQYGWNMAKIVRKQRKLRKGYHHRKDGQSEKLHRDPDFPSIMDHLAHASSLVIVCRRSLAAELDEAVHEEQALSEAITLLQRVYDEIDDADRTFRFAQQHTIPRG